MLIDMHVVLVLYSPVPGTDVGNGSNHFPALEGPFPSHKLQQPVTLPYAGDDIVKGELTCHVAIMPLKHLIGMNGLCFSGKTDPLSVGSR